MSLADKPGSRKLVEGVPYEPMEHLDILRAYDPNSVGFTEADYHRAKALLKAAGWPMTMLTETMEKERARRLARQALIKEVQAKAWGPSREMSLLDRAGLDRAGWNDDGFWYQNCSRVLVSKQGAICAGCLALHSGNRGTISIEDQKRRLKILIITQDVLPALFQGHGWMRVANFPSGVEVVNVSYDPMRMGFTVLVRHPDFEIIPEGELLPTVLVDCLVENRPNVCPACGTGPQDGHKANCAWFLARFGEPGVLEPAIIDLKLSASAEEAAETIRHWQEMICKALEIPPQLIS